MCRYPSGADQGNADGIGQCGQSLSYIISKTNDNLRIGCGCNTVTQTSSGYSDGTISTNCDANGIDATSDTMLFALMCIVLFQSIVLVTTMTDMSLKPTATNNEKQV